VTIVLERKDMDYHIVDYFPHSLLLKEEGPCISLFMETSNLIGGRDKDQLVFKNLVQEARDSIKHHYPSRDYALVFQTFDVINNDTALWNQMKQGIAVFASFNTIIIYVCHKRFKNQLIVANSFHLKPLVAYYQDKMMFTILALEADHFKVYLGSGYDIENIVLPHDIKTTLAGLLGSQRTDSYHTPGSYGGAMVGTNYHGHGGKKDDIEKDKEKFFRYIFKTMHELSLSKYPYPILVISTAVNHPLFQSIGLNPLIVSPYIDGSVDREDKASILNKIKLVQDQIYHASIQRLINHYHQSVPSMVSGMLDEILKKMMQGNVETLFIELDKERPGKLDTLQYQSQALPIDSIDVDDMLDDMLQEAYKHGVKVYVLTKDMMPTDTGIAAIYRYNEPSIAKI